MWIHRKATNCPSESIHGKDQFLLWKLSASLWTNLLWVYINTWNKNTYLFCRKWLKYLATTWGQMISSQPKSCIIDVTGWGWRSDGAVLGKSIASKVKSRFTMRETYSENVKKKEKNHYLPSNYVNSDFFKKSALNSKCHILEMYNRKLKLN